MNHLETPRSWVLLRLERRIMVLTRKEERKVQQESRRNSEKCSQLESDMEHLELQLQRVEDEKQQLLDDIVRLKNDNDRLEAFSKKTHGKVLVLKRHKVNQRLMEDKIETLQKKILSYKLANKKRKRRE